ncbi:MAG: hypothetical protein HDQ87_04360 [Clostridia bacterium]|nr:hypothetical protein [Clostridia bacterium]
MRHEDRARQAARAPLALLLSLCLMLAAGCAGAGTSAEPAATIAGVTLVEETGLLEAEQLPASTFAFEIMPEADDHIAELQIQYAGGPDGEFLGQLVLEPELDSYFTRQDTFRRGFTVPDEALLENFTLTFIMVDENGQETQAQNVFSVDAAYGITYFLKIGGSRDEGYVIETR